MIVRGAAVNDIDAIFGIRTSVRENHLSFEQLADRGITPDTLAQAMEAAECIWIAEIDGIPAGFTMIDDKDGCVFAMFVRPEFEGRGAGRALMAKAEAALFRNHHRIWLETEPTSRAAGFYRSLGWNPTNAPLEGDMRFEKMRA